MQANLAQLRAERKAVSRKVTLDSLSEDQRPTQLAPLNKILTDSVKMIAYRAETALVTLLRRHLKKEDEARALSGELALLEREWKEAEELAAIADGLVNAPDVEP